MGGVSFSMARPEVMIAACWATVIEVVALTCRSRMGPSGEFVAAAGLSAIFLAAVFTESRAGWA